MVRKSGSLIWGALLIVLGAVLLLENLHLVHIVGRLVWSAVLAGIGLPFLLVYASNRDQWWALIPGCVMVGIGAGVFLEHSVLTPVVILGGISLPFWLIYLTDRSNWWALIPAWVMACVAGIVVLDVLPLPDELIATYVMFAIAIPFLAVYLAKRDQWWALIPAGIMATIGILILVGAVFTSSAVWAVVLIAAGCWLLLRAFRSGRSVPAEPLPAELVEPSRFAESEPLEPAGQPDEPR